MRPAQMLAEHSKFDGFADTASSRELPSSEAKWDGPYLKKALPPDPWGKPYMYRSPGEHGEFDIYSYGKDGQAGGSGENVDIVSW